FHRWMPFAGRPAGAAQRDAVVHRHIVADRRGLPDHHARAMIDEEAAADRRGRMDVHVGHQAREPRQHTGTEAQLDLPQTMRHTMDQHRVHAGVGEQDLRHVARGRVALAHAGHIATDLPPERRGPRQRRVHDCGVQHRRYSAAIGIAANGETWRARATIDGRRSSTRATSSMRLSRANEKRMAPCTDRYGTAIARNTCEGSIDPEPQAEPDDAAMPKWLRPSRIGSASAFSNAMHEVLGSRAIGSPRIVAPSIARVTPRSNA